MGGPRVVGIGRATALSGPSRGDIHFIEFPEVGGHVIRGPHPAVVVQTDRMRRGTTVVLAPMTSSPKSALEQPSYLVAVSARDSGLNKDGFVKCDQLATLPTTMLGQRAGRLPPEAIERLDASLRFVLD